MARRKGDAWWIGALTNWTARDLTVKAEFLGAGGFTMKSWEDGPNAAKEGTDHVVKETQLTKDSKFTIRMAQGGGFAAVVRKGR